MDRHRPGGTRRADLATAEVLVDAGPLGFALVAVAAEADGTGPRAAALFFSEDGITWSVTDLATVGAPPGRWPAQVLVGADHIGISYSKPPGDGEKSVTLLAPPRR